MVDRSQNHIIREQVLDVQYNGKADGFLLQQEVIAWCNGEMNQQISEICNAFSGDYVHVIDKLELDIDVGSDSSWRETATRQIASRLREQLLLQVKPVPNDYTRTGTQRFADAFLFFLENGAFPWYYPAPIPEELDDLLRQLSLSIDIDLRMKARKVLANDHARARLIQHTKDAQLVELVTALWNEEGVYVARIASEMGTFNNEDRRSTKSLLLYLLVEGNVHDLQNLSVVMQRNKIAAVKDIQNEIQNKRPDQPKVNNDTKKDEFVYVQNAGLILAAPYLPALFLRLGVSTGAAIVDMNKAIRLTHFIGAGRQMHAEYEAGFARYLCGAPPTFAVDVTPEVIDQEAEEINSLLQSMIEHWNVLRDSSVDALRESFLQRPGKITFKEKELLVEVEQKAFDVLLSRLPWNIRLVKLPWLNRIIKTQWVG
jgi:hypothetical protein